MCLLHLARQGAHARIVLLLDELQAAVYAFLVWFNAQNAPPFRWTYRPKSWD